MPSVAEAAYPELLQRVDFVTVRRQKQGAEGRVEKGKA